jgi:uncharacterized membrane-anchored protein
MADIGLVVLVAALSSPSWVPGTIVGAVVAGPNRRLTGAVVGGVAQYVLFQYVIEPMVIKANRPGT